MRIKYSIYLLTVALLGLGLESKVYSQQDPQYTNYMYNTNHVNPAYAGSREGINVFGLYRTQWVGLEGAPKTANISVTAPLTNSGLGLGVSFSNDRLGVMDQNNIAIDLSYAIDLNYEYKLAFGLKASGNLISIDYDRLTIYNPNDIVSQENIKNRFKPNVGAGVYLYSDKSYLGFSVPSFLQQDHYDDNSITVMRQKLHYYLMGGYVFDLSDQIKFKPAFLMKAVEGAPLQVDLTANFLLAEKVTLGAAYRWDAAISILGGFQINRNLMIGYAYDFETTALRHYNSGSHEFFLRFELFNRTSRVNTPRFF